MISQARPRAATGALLLADIGGYTSFLRAVATAHANDAFADGAIPDAYAMLSSLLDGIVGRLAPPFTMSKLEGDAVLTYALEPTLPRGAAVRACIDATYADFRGRLDAAHEVWACDCDACLRIDVLELKFIVHAGPFVIHEIVGNLELVGPEVVMAHRLLKTEAAEVVGQGAYVLVTAAATNLLEIPTEGSIPLVARYEHYPPIDAFVFPLQRT